MTVSARVPFELPRGLNPPTLLALGPTSTALLARTRRGAERHAPKPSPSGPGGDTGPAAPLGPPGSVAVAGGGGAPGGASSALWCVILVGLLVYSAQELRRHRVRPVLSGPVGVVSLLQRPG